jgi:hypothetical protein
VAVVYAPIETPAPLSQVFPQGQSDWQQMLNQLNSWQRILSGASVKWLTPTLLNGWVGSPGYYQDLTRRVWCRGLLTAGTKTDGTQLLVLPYPPPAPVNILSYGFNGSTVAPVGLTVDTAGNVAVSGIAAFTGSYSVSLDQLNFSVVV